VSGGLGEGAERVIIFRVICGLGFLCDSPKLCNITPLHLYVLWRPIYRQNVVWSPQLVPQLFFIFCIF
jgi:hypothetical protein